MVENKILSEEEYYLANLGNSKFKSYKEYQQYELRNDLISALDILFKFNEMSFHPNQEINFTEIVNGFSALQLNNINYIVDKFQSRISGWDYRVVRDEE